MCDRGDTAHTQMDCARVSECSALPCHAILYHALFSMLRNVTETEREREPMGRPHQQQNSVVDGPSRMGDGQR